MSGVCYIGEGAKERALRQGRAIEASVRRRRDNARFEEARKLNRVMYPQLAEARYQRELIKRGRSLHAAVVSALKPATKKRAKDINKRARQDTAEDDASALIKVVKKVEKKWSKANPPTQLPLPGIAAQVDKGTTAKVSREIQVLSGVKTSYLFEPSVGVGKDWVSSNVGLIKSTDAKHFDRIEKAVVDTVGTGKSTKSLAEEIANVRGVSDRHNRLIARDQVGKLNGKITEDKHLQVGIDSYQWQTSGDERVREEHEILDGTKHKYASPPSVGNPGEDVQCRCVGIGILKDQNEIDLISHSLDLQLAERARLLSVAATSTGKLARNARKKVKEINARRPVPLPASTNKQLSDLVDIERTRRKRRKTPAWAQQQMARRHSTWAKPAPWQDKYQAVARKWVAAKR